MKNKTDSTLPAPVQTVADLQTLISLFTGSEKDNPATLAGYGLTPESVAGYVAGLRAQLSASVSAMTPAAMGEVLAGLVIANVTGSAPALPQIVAGHSVRIMRKKNGAGQHGARVAEIDGVQRVPVELLPLCAGRDVWMREIRVKCLECRAETRAGDMENEFCPACFEKALAEVGD